MQRISVKHVFVNPRLVVDQVVKTQVRTFRPYILEQLTDGKMVKVGQSIKMVGRPSKGRDREPWQKVVCKGEEKELREINIIECNERLKIRPKDAMEVARRKMQSLSDNLKKSGFCRETKPYEPPADAVDRIRVIVDECLKVKDGERWTDTPLDDSLVKYQLLTRCERAFNYEMPNSLLFTITKVSDVVEFYTSPVRGVNSYDNLVRKSNELPNNLHIIAEPLRYNPDNDNFFGGINAYPYNALKETDIRAKRKYPSFKSKFQWPDI